MIGRKAVLFMIFFVVSLPAVAEEWRAGFAKVVITPSELIWLSGYGARTKPAEGKVHDLYAKAMAIEDAAGMRLVLITLDLGSVNVHTTEYVAAHAEKRFGLHRPNLVLNCSHTHCAAEVSAERRVFLNVSEQEHKKLTSYIEKDLNPKLVDLIGDAIGDLKPAVLSVGKSEAGFAFNRRDPSGIAKDGVTDRDVPVLRVASPQGKLRGLVFGYACHNTTCSGQLYCGDYAGFAQYDVEVTHPGATALFLMGCGGDQNPQPRHGMKEIEYAKQHGRDLADAVESALSREQQPLAGPLRIAYKVATLDLDSPPPITALQADAKLPPSKVESRKANYLLGIIAAGHQIPVSQTCPLHVARFGKDFLMIFVSGETLVDYSLRCKRDFRGPFVWVAGYCDDVFAYLPSRRVRIEGGYEGLDSVVHQLMASPFQPNVEDKVMDSITRLVKETDR